jgi:hypothetical protein
MRIDRDMLGWGVFFLVAGGVSIGVQQGVTVLSIRRAPSGPPAAG